MEKLMTDNSLPSNYECYLLRSMIALITIVFCIFGGFVDGNPTNHFTIWMYFLGIAPVIFIFTLIINKYTHLSLFLLFFIMIISNLVFNKLLIYDLDGVISPYKISLVILHFITINFFFWKISKTLLINDADIDIPLVEKTGSSKNSRRLVRRSNRRNKSRTKNNTNIKSGQYRG